MSTAPQSSAQSQVSGGSGWATMLEKSIREVFEMMLGTELKSVPGPFSISGEALTAVIGLAGNICGVVSVSCSSKTATRIAGKMLGTDPDGLDVTVRDALGEICNMVAGGFKCKVGEMGRHCSLSLPTAIIGADFNLQSLADGERLEVILGFEEETLRVALDLHTEAMALQPGVFRKPGLSRAVKPKTVRAGNGSSYQPSSTVPGSVSAAWSENEERRKMLIKEWAPMLEDATREVYEVMLETELGVGTDSERSAESDLTAMVGVAGQLCGVLTVRCRAESASRMASKMLGVEATQSAESVRDALGEISNMVAGTFRSKIPDLAEKCNLSVPTVVSGPDYEFHALAEGDRVEVCLSFDGEPLWVVLDLHA